LSTFLKTIPLQGGREGTMKVNIAPAWAPYLYAARWRCLPCTDKGTRAPCARVSYKKSRQKAA